jgi:hypothetical protein
MTWLSLFFSKFSPKTIDPADAGIATKQGIRRGGAPTGTSPRLDQPVEWMHRRASGARLRRPGRMRR